ncbi:MAG TPA: type VII secretion protein EccB [Pseudonocardiaceae bacterium]
MPKDPTTVSEVQAYRFMLRRMESALVRKDAVMVHEPLRAHNKAALVGVILGLLGLVAFFVIGRFSPTSKLQGGEIVIGKSSSAIFVVQPQPLRLIPVLNMASARLLLSVLSPGATSAPDAQVVDESVLDSLPHTSTTGIPGAPTRVPATQDLIAGPWSVCDSVAASADLPDAQTPQVPTTVAVLGVPQPGRALGPNQALLVQVPGSGTTYLVRAGQRNRVDLTDPAVRVAYHVDQTRVRPTSADLLNAIPEGHPLSPPSDIQTDAAVPQLSGRHPGDVVAVDRAEGKELYLLLPQGKQRITKAVADLIRARYDRTNPETPTIALGAIANVPDVPAAYQEDFSDYPDVAPNILPAATTNICANISDPNRAPVITTSQDPQLQLGQGNNPVPVPGAVSGRTADNVYVPPGKGALVRGVVPGQPPNTGQIWLVTEQGERYAVPSIQVAQILGLGNVTSPAPEPVLKLLPQGPTLDPQKALRLFNSATANQQQGGG